MLQKMELRFVRTHTLELSEALTFSNKSSEVGRLKVSLNLQCAALELRTHHYYYKRKSHDAKKHSYKEQYNEQYLLTATAEYQCIKQVFFHKFGKYIDDC